MGKLRRRQRGAGQSWAVKPPRPPGLATTTHARGVGRNSLRCDPRRPSRWGRGAGREAPGHTPRPRGRRAPVPGANKRRVCRLRGGRRGPGAARTPWSRALRRGQRSPGGRGDRSGAAVANTPAGTSNPRARATQRPPTGGKKLGRPARQGRKPGVARASGSAPGMSPQPTSKE